MNVMNLNEEVKEENKVRKMDRRKVKWEEEQEQLASLHSTL